MTPSPTPTPMPIFAPVLSWLVSLELLPELLALDETDVKAVVLPVCDVPRCDAEDVEADCITIEAPEVADVAPDVAPGLTYAEGSNLALSKLN